MLKITIGDTDVQGMSRFRSSRWRASRVRPVGISLRMSCRALAAMLAVVSALLALSAVVPGGETGLAGLGAGAVSLVLVVVLLTCWERLPVWSFFVIHAAESVVLGLSVRHADTATSALAYGTLFVLVLIESFFVLSWVEAGFEFVLGTAALVWGLQAHPAVTPSDEVVLVGVLAATCGVAGWLVRAMGKADIDHLTGLPNRRGVQRQAEAMSLRAQRRGMPLGLALIDLDHFKTVNDTLGHAGGDLLLREVAAAARAVMPSPGVFGRWGGDEFALLVPTHSAAEVATLVEGIRAGLPAGRTMSAGVGMWHADQELSTVVQRADHALYEVKRSRRGVTQVFDEAGHGLLAQAVSAGEIEVHHQAVVDQAADATVGAEALVHRRRPGRGLLAPADFLSQAESSGDIIALGHRVLRRVCAAAARWPAFPDGRPRTVAVNASGRELAERG
jgi:diguanylate cyclase (GGDEF)-like protein